LERGGRVKAITRTASAVKNDRTQDVDDYNISLK